MIRSARSLLLLIVVAGCDPAFRLAGTVKTVSGLAIAGAEVRMSCANRRATSDASGAFVAHGIGFYSDECGVVIEAAGYTPIRTEVGGHCLARWAGRRDACVDVHVDAVLTPAR
jgi:hypothetical protein